MQRRTIATLKWMWRHRVLVSFLFVVCWFSAQFALLKIPEASAAYTVDNSARFNDDDSAYLIRTPGSTASTYTISMWIKRSTLGNHMLLINRKVGAGTIAGLFFDTSERLEFSSFTAPSTYNFRLITTGVYRDPSQWLHIVASYNNTTAKLYVNGVEPALTTNTQSAGAPSPFTSGQAVALGRYGDFSGFYYDGYVSDVYMVDGQALSPTCFGEYDANGYWRPKAYSTSECGAYGTNGFKLNFSNGSALGTDTSGNGNNWTVNNLDATDQVIDTPTNGYATTNNLWNGISSAITNGNLQIAGQADRIYPGTMAVSSDKWYFEVTQGTVYSGSTHAAAIGWLPASRAISSANLGDTDYGWAGYQGGGDGLYSRFNSSSNKIINGAPAVNDVLMTAIDMDSGKIWFGRNCAWATGDPAAGTSPTFSGVSGQLVPASANNAGGSLSNFTVNFGQGGTTTLAYNSAAGGYFYCTPPTGFKALSTANLPEPDIVVPKNYFDAVTYTGNGNTTRSITGLNFQPDMVWHKARSAADDHRIMDAVRGAANILFPNLTLAEDGTLTGYFTFASGGYDLAVNASPFNVNSRTYVSWNWKESPTAGFDIVTWTGDGTNPRSVSHNLGAAPRFIFTHARNTTSNWAVYVDACGTNNLVLDLTNGCLAGGVWASAPTASVFNITSSSAVNTNGTTYVGYLFAEVPGFSKFGSYTGNGSADGPFVYTGFKPRFVMIKNSGATANWVIHDTARETYNPSDILLYPNLAQGEDNPGGQAIDVLSNGFKIRTTSSGSNTSSGTYIYAAFAEQPFKYSAMPAELAASINAGTTFLMGMEI